MRVEKDFEGLLKLFNQHNVRYCIIGSFALAFHAIPRYTKDLDIFVDPTIANGKKIIAALEEFGFGSFGLTAQDFTKRGQIVQLGYEPIRIDILTSVPGHTFNKIWKTKAIGIYGNQRVYFIGLKELIDIKTNSGREQDKIDLVILKRKLQRQKEH